MLAVHFGAGNIGRGFVGMLLHEAGVEVVFADVAEKLIDDLKNSGSYTVHAVGTGGFDYTVDGYRAVNSAKEPEALTAELAKADIITTAVGPHILKFVAPAIAAGIAARPEGSPRVAIMACENAINATDILEEEVRKNYKGSDLDERALFANTAVDRIVPAQAPDAGLDVTVEVFHEWVVDRTPFGGTEPEIPGITWVNNLEPYIERTLFTLGTGHAATAWFGYRAGYSQISEAITDREVRPWVVAVLAETGQLLVAKHGIDIQVQQAYMNKILDRFANPYLPDTAERVGRGPLRKLSRNDRIVGPAAQLAERGLDYTSLVDAFCAGLAFNPEGDPEVDELQSLLSGGDPHTIVTRVTGIEAEHPLYPALLAAVERHLAARR